MREGKTERQRERDEDRYHPYTGHRPSSPLGLHHSLEQVSNSWEQVTDIEEKQKPRIVGHGLLGIAALVSAAEEKVREEEVNVRA